MLCEQHDETRCHDLTRCRVTTRHDLSGCRPAARDVPTRKGVSSDRVIGGCCDGTNDREVPQIKIFYRATQVEFHGIERINYNCL